MAQAMENIRQETRPIDLLDHLETVSTRLSGKEAEMLVPIQSHLGRFLGPRLTIPNLKMLADLPARFGEFLRQEGKNANTVKNYTYRTRNLVKLLCKHVPALAGLDSLPAAMPDFSQGITGREKRLVRAYRIHKAWRERSGIPLSQSAGQVFRKYEKHLLRDKDYTYETARVRYMDLQAFWAEMAARWLLPVVEIPDMKLRGSRRIGVVKQLWPEGVRNQFDWYLACCRGEVATSTVKRKKGRGQHSENNLEGDIRLFLGYLQNEREMDLTGGDLLSVLSKSQELREFLDWHRKAKKEGKAAIIHKRILQDFAVVLEDLGEEELPDLYRRWASQLNPERVRVKFQDTIASFEMVLEPIQELLERTARECDEIFASQWAHLSDRQRADVATRFQDALMFAFFCLLPIRVSNMIDLRSGITLLRHGTCGYRVCIGPDDFKSGYDFEIDFPSMLVDYLEKFIARWRPVLNKLNDDLLFHTRVGGALRYKAANERMIKMGKELFGIHTNPHHFRMFGPSAYLSDHPEDLDQIRALLGHKFIRTTVEQYTHLFTLNASRKAAQFARDTSPDFSDLCAGLTLDERVKDAIHRYSPQISPQVT